MKNLFSTTSIQGLELKNRLVALPVFTGYALPDARISPLMFEHYRRLGESGAALVVVPNVAVSANGGTSERSLLLDHDKHVAGLSRLARVIKENGAIACIQLNHAGRYANTDHPFLPSALNAAEATKSVSTLKNFMESFPFVKRFGLTAHVAKMTAGWTQQMSDADIENTVELFGEAAVRACEAGFEMIELHGATGYLITQFLSAATNRRPPPWGGSAENRMRFPLAVLDRIKERIPASVPVGFRLTIDELSKNGISVSEAMEFAEKLEQHGIAYLSASVGTYQSMFTPEVVKQLVKPGYLSSKTKMLKDRVNVPVVTSGRIVAPKLAEKILQNREADLIGLGRPLLADPAWIKKALNNGKIIGCKNCNTCFRYVALGQSVICDLWPKAVKDRIKLETRFTSRHAYRTLIVISSKADIEILKNQVRQRVPIHEDIFDRQLFINAGREEGFAEAAREHAAWCDNYVRVHLGRGRRESIFVDDFQDPFDVVMEHLKDNFGVVSLVHDGKSKWKNSLVLNAPADIVVFRSGTHPNIKKVLVPCDLSVFTLMQISAALHAFHGRPKVDYRFVHVSQQPEEAALKWSRIINNFEFDQPPALKIIPNENGPNVAEILLDEAKSGEYGSLVLGRRGGLARMRRRIMGSVSKRLLGELPECSFAIVG